MHRCTSDTSRTVIPDKTWRVPHNTVINIINIITKTVYMNSIRDTLRGRMHEHTYLVMCMLCVAYEVVQYVQERYVYISVAYE
jgi:hypothetical protein